MSYEGIVNIVLGLICAAREGNLDRHLKSVQTMIPRLFAYDRIDHAWYLPHSYASITSLKYRMLGCQMNSTKVDSPCNLELQIHLLKFKQTGQLQTINRDSQISGGIKGFQNTYEIYMYGFWAIFLSQTLSVRGKRHQLSYLALTVA